METSETRHQDDDDDSDSDTVIPQTEWSQSPRRIQTSIQGKLYFWTKMKYGDGMGRESESSRKKQGRSITKSVPNSNKRRRCSQYVGALMGLKRRREDEPSWGYQAAGSVADGQ
jgi:hypothetical protein